MSDPIRDRRPPSQVRESFSYLLGRAQACAEGRPLALLYPRRTRHRRPQDARRDHHPAPRQLPASNTEGRIQSYAAASCGDQRRVRRKGPRALHGTTHAQPAATRPEPPFCGRQRRRGARRPITTGASSRNGAPRIRGTGPRHRPHATIRTSAARRKPHRTHAPQTGEHHPTLPQDIPARHWTGPARREPKFGGPTTILRPSWRPRVAAVRRSSRRSSSCQATALRRARKLTPPAPAIAIRQLPPAGPRFGPRHPPALARDLLPASPAIASAEPASNLSPGGAGAAEHSLRTPGVVRPRRTSSDSAFLRTPQPPAAYARVDARRPLLAALGAPQEQPR
jgi:hypothetical protein